MTDIKIDKIIRSKRKSLCLEVTRDAKLVVKAPRNATSEYIEQVVFGKKRWIEKKQQRAREKLHLLRPKEFVDGEQFFYVGREYPLRIVEDADAPVSIKSELILSSKYLPRAGRVITEWYKKEAFRLIGARLDWYADLYGIKYNGFKLSNAKKRWGTCSAGDNLSFSWRLIMAPLKVIDYIIVHELAHVIEKNHQRKFWEIVERMLPGYKEQRKWLKENGEYLGAGLSAQVVNR